jgi:hypothetical protein
MRYWIIFSVLLFYVNNLHGQKLNGIYTWSGELKGAESDFGITTLEITSDSTYTQTDLIGYKSDFNQRESKWKKTVRKGTIKKEGRFYVLSNKGFQNSWHLVTIHKNKLIFYGYMVKKSGKSKKVKGIELKKVQE